MARFPQPAPQPAHAPPGKPFDINDYTALARELTATVQQLDQMLQQLERSTPAVQGLATNTVDRLEQVLNGAFTKLAWLIVLLIVGSFGAALAYRVIVRKLPGNAQ